ncbi:MAG: CRISPR-associated protein Cas4, partial [Candidatus Brocadiia bacterium]
EGVWLANPVEHKRGKPKIDDCDEVQLCAQAMCIEEMLNTEIPSGDLFYGLPRRRHQVEMTAGLRKRTESLALRLHALFASEKTPPPSCGPQCQNCSLQTSCMPNTVSRSSGVRAFLRRMKSRERE